MDKDGIFERRRRYRAQIPDLYGGAYKKLYDKAMAGKSRKSGVEAKCLECNCFQSAEVKDCEIPDCPLWPYRPYRKAVRR